MPAGLNPMMDEATAAELAPAKPNATIGSGFRAVHGRRTGHRGVRDRRLPQDLRGPSARGVEFVQEPAECPYGIEAVFKDVSGNWFSLTQRHG